MDDESSSPREVTRLLAAWTQGDALALEKLTRLVYVELRRLAHRYMGQQRHDQRRDWTFSRARLFAELGRVD
jgi:ECF sigma factor